MHGGTSSSVRVILNTVLSLLSLFLYSCRGDLDLSRLNLLKTLGLWRELRERLYLLGDIILDLEYADSCALVLFFQASAKLSLLLLLSGYLYLSSHNSSYAAMIGSSFQVLFRSNFFEILQRSSSEEPWGVCLSYLIVLRTIRPGMARGRLFVIAHGEYFQGTQLFGSHGWRQLVSTKTVYGNEYGSILFIGLDQ
ncbi:hypothetical protein Tco_0612711 [Tanacetum coccineum]